MLNVMTAKEAAKRLHVTDQTVWKYIKGGKLRGRKVGRQYLIPIEQVEALMEPEEPQTSGDTQA